MNSQTEADSSIGKNWVFLYCLFQGAANMAKAKMWNNGGNNSCQIIVSSQCNLKILTHSYFIFFDY